MKLTCCQCSRVIFGIPRFSQGKTFCDNDFCLEEFRKVQQGMYRRTVMPNSIFPTSMLLIRRLRPVGPQPNP